MDFCSFSTNASSVSESASGGLPFRGLRESRGVLYFLTKLLTQNMIKHCEKLLSN